MSLRPRGAWRIVFALLLVLAGCTAEEPAPAPTPAPEPSVAATGPSGVRAGIVLPPAGDASDPQLAQITAAMRPLQAALPDLVTQLRPITPDGPEFVGDVARLLVDRGTDLVCVVGSDGVRVTNQLAARHPELRFCAVPTGGNEVPDNVRIVDVRLEELGHVVGVAAAEAAGDAPVALVLAPDRLGYQRFRDGLRAGAGDTELLEAYPKSSEEAQAAVAAAIDEGAEVLVLDVGWRPAELLEVAQDAGLALAAPLPALAGDRLQAATVLAWSVRWELALGPVVQRLADDDVEVPDAVGLADEAFVLTPGPQGARGPLDRAVAELRDGDRQAVPPREE
ncbi:hypothetical protein [Egicoccus sp. AB-alg2]|uniref:hypothetical protein n=1 Tax=Egicoccus sp. AB-alg2 TaxID=3242693 RepID=UPI00359E4FD3